MVYSEALGSALTAYSGCGRRITYLKAVGDDNPVAEKVISATLLQSKMFWWAEATADAVACAAENYPSDLLFSRDLLYCDFGWAYFDVPVYRETDPNDSSRVWGQINAVQWIYTQLADQNMYLIVIPWSCISGFWMHLPTAVLREGSTLTELATIVAPGAEILLTRFVLAAGAWLRQRILTTHEEHPNHQTRKTIKREFGNITVPNIQVVQLRRTASAPHESASVSERDWHCQWMVRGHWRNQYYASSGDHMPKYIHPYIKGPEDMPLKPSSGEIFAVTR